MKPKPHDPPVAYIAAPYRAPTINGIANNIAEARKLAEWAWLAGYAPICPHLNSSFIDGLVPDEVILPAYLKLVSLSDFIIYHWRWESSQGARDELALGVKLGKKFILDPVNLSLEAAYHEPKMFPLSVADFVKEKGSLGRTLLFRSVPTPNRPDNSRSPRS